MKLPRPADFEGILSLLAADNGDRQAAAHSGYSPAHQLYAHEASSGIHEYLDGDQVQPGSSGRVAVCLSAPDRYPASLWEGREIHILEGKRQVGWLTVNKIHNAALRTSPADYLAKWQAPRLAEIGACLLKLFQGDDYQIHHPTLQRLHALQASPLHLRMDAELFKGVMRMPGYATADAVASILTGYRLNYTRSLAAFQAASKNEKFLGLVQGGARKKAQEAYTLVVTDLGHLMHALPGYGHLAEEEVLALLDSGDTFLISSAGTIMEAFPTLHEQHLEQLLATMEKQGVHQWPYQPGIALAAALTQNPWGFETVMNRFENANDNLQVGILESFKSLEMALPLPMQDMLVRRAQVADRNHHGEVYDEVYSSIIVALALCKDRPAEALAILAPCLASEAWYIRGNAAVSLGILGLSTVKDAALINRLGDMIFDTEGHDWDVQSATLQALTKLGGTAHSQLSKLLRLAQMHEKEDDFYDCPNQLLANCFGAIADDSAAVVAALHKIVARQGHISAGAAIIALGKLGKAALPAMEAIEAFIFHEDSYIEDAEQARAIITACIAISGADDTRVNNCIRHLTKSVHAEVAEVAHQFLTMPS
ncbi:HEAT repeat domain-containing protein [Undibacterium sp. Di27W]|uniref:HEAT repeat domain-containing protein n=1 Tax=Undibacterium sp. Di27W TaxID=3413036 RepID=UPI003BF26477